MVQGLLHTIVLKLLSLAPNHLDLDPRPPDSEKTVGRKESPSPVSYGQG